MPSAPRPTVCKISLAALPALSLLQLIVHAVPRGGHAWHIVLGVGFYPVLAVMFGAILAMKLEGSPRTLLIVNAALVVAASLWFLVNYSLFTIFLLSYYLSAG